MEDRRRAKLEDWFLNCQESGVQTSRHERSSTFCFTSTEARWLIRGGDVGGGGGAKDEGSTAGTARKRPERP